MIYFDMDGIEAISNMLSRLSADIENEFLRLKQIENEMRDNTELQSYPLYGKACDAMFQVTDEMNSVREKSISNNSIISNGVAEYGDKEKEKLEEIKKLDRYFSLVSQNFTMAMNSEYVPQLEKTGEMVSEQELKNLVAGEAMDMKITNISAVMSKVQEDYPVNTVVVTESNGK